MAFTWDPAPKSAIAIIIDLAYPELNEAIETAKDIIESRIFFGKNDKIAILFSSSAKTKNHLDENGEYQNIFMKKELSPTSWDHYDAFKDFQITKDSIEISDVLDPIIVAADHINLFHKTSKNQESSRILFFSDFGELSDVDDVIEVERVLIDKKISFNAVIPNEMEESQNSRIMKRFALNTGGFSTNLSQFQANIHQLEVMRKNFMRTKGFLQMGANFEVPIRSIALFTQNEFMKLEKVLMNKDKLENLKIVKILKVKDQPQIGNDESSEQIEEQDLIKAFRFCDSLIPLNEHDINQIDRGKSMNVGIDILNFITLNKIDVNIIYGKTAKLILPDGLGAKKLMDSLARCMHVRKLAAIIRFKHNKSMTPRLGILLANTNQDLIVVRYPLVEDLRYYNYDQQVLRSDTGGLVDRMKEFIKANEIETKDTFKLIDPFPIIIKKIHRLLYESKNKKMRDIDEATKSKLFYSSVHLKENLGKIESSKSGFNGALENLPKKQKA